MSVAKPDKPALSADGYVDHLGRAAEAAVASMRRHGIAPSVENYAIWFHNHAGYNPALSRMITMLEEAGDGFDRSRQAELHRRFIDHGSETRVAHESIGRAGAALEAVLRNVESLRRDTQGYGDLLGEAAIDIAGATRIEELGQLVTALQQETDGIRERTEVLQAELVQRNEEVGALRFELQRARLAVNTDPLTGIGNRRMFDDALRLAIIETTDHAAPLSLLLIDVDHFKRFNDAHGHQTGDLVLRLLALRLKEMVKGRDTPIRFGGEEFAVILPQTPIAGALEVAEQIRKDIGSKRVQLRASGEQLGEITLSIGAAAFRAGEPPATLVERADRALYLAKQQGRNRVVAETETAVG